MGKDYLRKQYCNSSPPLRMGSSCEDWINDGRTRPKIADVDITFVKDVTQLEDLKPYVSKSGFRGLIEWNNAIMELNPRFAFEEVKNGYLYKVSIRKVK